MDFGTTNTVAGTKPLHGLNDGNLPNPNNTRKTEDRDASRRAFWQNRFPRTGVIRYRLWWLFHNCLVHPLLAVPCRYTHALHDWASDRLAGRHHLQRRQLEQQPLR